MTALDFYYVPFSPPCRSVLMVAEALNLKLNLKLTNTREKEHLTPEFLKMNPQHTIPTMVDDGFALWESRAILTYLVSKYGEGSGLYPKDPKARAVVDQRLFFDIGTLYQRFADYVFPQFTSGEAPNAAKLKKMEESLVFLETFLEGQRYVAGDSLTVADYSILATVSNFSLFGVDVLTYPNIKAWYERMKSAPGYNKNVEGLQAFSALIEGFKRNSS